MKKLLVFLALFVTISANGEALKGSVSETKIPKGFFGTWHVTSKLYAATDFSKFNKISVDVWSLSGHGNTLVLENPFSGATSQIQVEDKNIEGKKLKFTRYKTEQEGEYIVKYTETPEIVLEGDIFRGTDTFIIEKFQNTTLIEKNVVQYKLVGQKISGESKLNE